MYIVCYNILSNKNNSVKYILQCIRYCRFLKIIINVHTFYFEHGCIYRLVDSQELLLIFRYVVSNGCHNLGLFTGTN